jgi:polygalacturonase
LITRRQLLVASAASGVASVSARTPPPSVFPAAEAQAIVDSIQLPRIPRRDFPLHDHGGRGDGKADNTQAIASAIKACADAGGGRVVMPVGTVLTGPIRLRSNVELHVPTGCRLKFIPEPARYLPAVHTRWEGVELMGYHPLIYAFDEHDVAVTGGGILDGSADDLTWWPWKGPWADKFKTVPLAERQAADRARLFEMAERGVPVAERVFGEGSRLRPPFFQPYRCKNVLFDGLTIVASPFWLLHPVECSNVTFRNATCSSHGPNNDGIDPESCTGVLIDRCTFDTGDDCIAIKAGRNADGRRLATPCERIVVRHCHMKDGHAGIAIGSEMTGGVKQVYVHDCTMDSPALTRALVLKSNSHRGGRMEDIHLTRIKAGTIDKAFVQIWLHYEEGNGGGFLPSAHRITISDSQVERTGRMLVVRGMAEQPVTGLVLSNVQVGQEAQPSVVLDTKDIVLDRVTVAGKTWTREHVARLPGLDSISCDKWAVCR